MADYNATDGTNNGAWSGIGWGQQWIGYSGVFDGNGHTIYNIDVYTDQAVGPKGLLFNITKDATIKNLAVKGKISANRYIGGLVGRTTGSITLDNVVVDAELSLSQGNANAIGGLIGQCGSGQTIGGENITINNCAAVGTYGSSTASNPVGGLIGHVYGGYTVRINNSYAAADLRCDGGDVAAFIAGQGTKDLKITNSYYLNTMADTSLIVMTANGDPSPVGPDSDFVEATPLSENEMKSADFITRLNDAFKSDNDSGFLLANGYPVPNGINKIEAEFQEFICIGQPRTTYSINEYFDLNGAYFVAKYTNGYNLIADYEVINTSPLTIDDTEVTVLLKCGGESDSKVFNITVEDIDHIEIQTLPQKTEYIEMQKFSKNGMVVLAYDSQGNSEVITNYSYTPDGELTLEDTVITVSYAGKSATIDITVTPRALRSVAIKTKPNNLIYAADEPLNLDGLVVTAKYTNNTLVAYTIPMKTAENPDGYTISENDQVVTVSYTYCDVTMTADFEITRLQSKAPDIKDGVYQLKNEDHMVWFANQINVLGKTDINGKLLADVDLSGDYYAQLYSSPGSILSASDKIAYSGNFDGVGHTIKLNLTSHYTRGVFNNVENGKISNLTVDGIIDPKDYASEVAGIVAYMKGGSVENCINKAQITEIGCAGGIVGIAQDVEIKNCANLGDVTGAYAGGIAGRITGGNISSCYNAGSLDVVTGPLEFEKAYLIGGIAGYCAANVSDCYNSGNISATSQEIQNDIYIGGIAGSAQAGCSEIKNVYSVDSLNSDSSYMGEIVGYIDNITEDGSLAPLRITNAYYEGSANAYNVNNSNGSSVAAANVEAKDSAWLKGSDALAALGDAFRMDSADKSLNNGYPVLSWQGGSRVIISDGIENGTIEVSASIVRPGETVKITATPEIGYELSKITVTNISDNSEIALSDENTFIMPEGDVNVTAVFRETGDKRYNIKTDAVSAGGTISTNMSEAVAGRSVTITATPETGYTLSSVVVINTDTESAIALVKNEDGTYTFTMPAADVEVSAMFSEENIKIEAGATQAVVDDKVGLDGEDLSLAQSAASSAESTTSTGLDKAVIDELKTADNKLEIGVDQTEAKQALKDAGKSVDDNALVLIVIEPYLDIKVTNAEAAINIITLDITPMYNIKATTAADANGMNETNSVVIKEAQKLETGNASIEITIPLPAVIKDSMLADRNYYAKHTKDSEIYYHKLTKVEGGVKFINNKGFSEFELPVEEKSIHVEYDNGIASKVLTNADIGSVLPVPSVSGTFNGWKFYTDSSKTTAVTGALGTYKTLTVELFDTLSAALTSEITTIYAVADITTGSDSSSNSSGSGGGGSSATTYTVTAPSSVDNGKITVSPKSAAKDSTVTITATPDEGYKVGTITVKDKDGNEIEIKDAGNGKYTFVMPASKVEISATFIEDNDTEDPTDPTEPTDPAEPGTVTYSDVAATAWYYDAVVYVTNNGLMNGVGNGLFAPNSNLTRAMFAQILYNKAGQPAAGASIFTDVAAGQWYTDAISWAAAQGVVNGLGNNMFGPDNNITREQLAVMLYRYAGSPAVTGGVTGFNDAGQISSYATDSMAWATTNGVMNGKGDGRLDPKGLATRAEVAQMMQNYFK